MSDKAHERWQRELKRLNALDECHPGAHEQTFVVEVCFAEWVQAVRAEGGSVPAGCNFETVIERSVPEAADRVDQ